MQQGIIKSFKDLNAWQEGHKLVLFTYTLTKLFPKEEVFGLTSQFRRCAVSITSNLAEGFSRNSTKEKLQFYSMALGSLTEWQNQLLIAKDVEYLSEDKYAEGDDLSITVSKLINGLLKYLRSHNT